MEKRVPYTPTLSCYALRGTERGHGTVGYAVVLGVGFYHRRVMCGTEVGYRRLRICGAERGYRMLRGLRWRVCGSAWGESTTWPSTSTRC
eukprot:956759-Rhodomonas_salina.1